jgi:hypothetical protein
MTEKLYTIVDAVEQTGYSDQYLRQLCREKKIPHIRRRGRIFFTAEDLGVITSGERVDVASPAPVEIEKPAAPNADGGGLE